ncbi:MAG TPA: membrane protein insertion efficiency factor YidD [Candidatus Dependentiae bacterium]|nr:membrane protein insertion efficiency factor YidD [Candidatus Dependentiae bacterium]HRQ62581.1 membrane protein insertion efficiency factor YidD [Candidatus Dependentiae bacterium]
MIRIINKLIIFIISGLRPLLGPAHCKYPVTCTPYAIEQLNTQPLHRALGLIIRRILSCNPFGG